MGRWKKRACVNHAAAIEGLREMPGVWLPVGTYPARYSAENTAHRIRIGRYGYIPPGAFEAYTKPVGDETGLYVRYIGQSAEGAA